MVELNEDNMDNTKDITSPTSCTLGLSEQTESDFLIEDKGVVTIKKSQSLEKILEAGANNERSLEMDACTLPRDDVECSIKNSEKGYVDFDKTIVPRVTVPLGKEQKGLKRFFGIFLAIIAALQFSLSALIIKVLEYPPFKLGVWRFFVMVFIPIPFLIHAVFWKKQNIFKGIWPVSSTTVFVLLQAILGANSIIFVFFGLKYMNMADSIVIITSAPVFVTLFAFLFLGEKCGLVPVLTAALALVGVTIISKPPILTGAAEMDENTVPGVISSFSSMILLTICYVVIRYLRTVHHAVVNLCFSLWGLLQCLVMASWMDVLELPDNYKDVGLIILTAFLAFFAQTCITLALKYEQAGPVALVRTSEVVFAFLWQAIFLGVEPDFFSVLGAVVTLSGVVLIALRKIIMALPGDHQYRKTFGLLLL